MNTVTYKGSKSKARKYTKFTIQGDGPCSFYIFQRGDEPLKDSWSGWITGDANLYHKLKKLEIKDVKAFMRLCAALTTLSAYS